MSREIRRVPARWEHPRKSHSEEHDYVQLSDDYVGYLKYYKEAVDNFIKHMTEVIRDGKTTIYDREFTSPRKVYGYLTEDEQLVPADVSGYMPNGDWYQLYQTVGEGSPLSPPFKTEPELVEWLTNNKDYWGRQWAPEQAAAIVDSGYSPSGVFANGRLYTSEEATTLVNDPIKEAK